MAELPNRPLTWASFTQFESEGPDCQLELALFFVRARIRVHPMCPRTKRPLTAHGFKDATTHEQRILEWWRRWPFALVALPTGSSSGFWVLDVDGTAGRQSLNGLLSQLGLERVVDLTRCVVKTPSGGLHLYFALLPGECPRTRARDLGPGLDTRGEGGTIIAPGNCLPDGRAYVAIDAANLAEGERAMIELFDLPAAPRLLVFVATFSARDRSEIARHPELLHAIRASDPVAWDAIIKEHRRRERERIVSPLGSAPPAPAAMRRQALSDLADTARVYGTLADGRRNSLFSVACRLARYTGNGVLTEAEVLASLGAAAESNGALAKHGRTWLERTIRRALAIGRHDPLPPLARRFREGGA